MKKKVDKRNSSDRRIEQRGLHENWNCIERRKKPGKRIKEWDKNLKVEDLSRDKNVDKQFLKQLKRKKKEKKLKESRKKGRIRKDLRNK